MLHAIGVGKRDLGAAANDRHACRELLVALAEDPERMLSSLRVLRDLEHAADDALIVQSTIELAHGLGLAIVAEGVETAGAAALMRWGAETLQGYLLSPPLAAEAFAVWLESTLVNATAPAPACLGLAR